MTQPVMMDDQHYKDKYEGVCECIWEADANVICDALNAADRFRWISVSERLPEEGVCVLVWLPGFGRASVASVRSDFSSRHWWNGEEEFFKGDCGVLFGDDDAPSHWMPLPEPPQ
jgi:hypothetical protein